MQVITMRLEGHDDYLPSDDPPDAPANATSFDVLPVPPFDMPPPKRSACPLFFYGKPLHNHEAYTQSVKGFIQIVKIFHDIGCPLNQPG